MGKHGTQFFSFRCSAALSAACHEVDVESLPRHWSISAIARLGGVLRFGTTRIGGSGALETLSATSLFAVPAVLRRDVRPAAQSLSLSRQRKGPKKGDPTA